MQVRRLLHSIMPIAQMHHGTSFLQPKSFVFPIILRNFAAEKKEADTSQRRQT